MIPHTARTLIRLLLAGALALSAGLPSLASAQNLPDIPGCEFVSGNDLNELYLFCVPDNWNGDLVVYAHGYISPRGGLNDFLAQLALPDGTPLPVLIQGLGYAFATTSYRENGLAVLTGVQDIRELVAAFPTAPRAHAPVHTYLAGVSEGGLITALLAEQSPELFTGALAACGPIGSFRQQLNYFGDFRVLFDYFFPGVLPPSPIDIPQLVMDNWASTYVPTIAARLAAQPSTALELIRTSKAAIDPADLTTVGRTAVNVLWYNVFATNDARAKLGGNPFDNSHRFYFGSSNDLRLNRRVQRFKADPSVIEALAPYQTSGHLTIPLVTLHTTGDEVVPFWQELLYLAKVDRASRGKFLPIPVFRYGHCNFTSPEVLAAFGLLVQRATGAQVSGLPMQYDAGQVQRDFLQAQGTFQAAAAQVEADR